MWDELNEPLGLSPGALAAPAFGRFPASGPAVAGLAALALAVGLTALAGRDARLGPDTPPAGEPFAVARVEAAPPPPKPATREIPPVAHEALSPPVASAEQVEAASGVRIMRGSGGPPRALIIDVARALGAKPGPDARPGEAPPGSPAPPNP